MQLKGTFLALALSLFAVVGHAKTLDDAELRKFLDPIQYTSVDISPSGKYISFIRRDDEKNTLIIMNLATMKPCLRQIWRKRQNQQTQRMLYPVGHRRATSVWNNPENGYP